MPRSLEQTLGARSTPHPARVALDDHDRGAHLRHSLRSIGRLLLQSVVFIVLVSVFFFRVPQVEGRSMQPNIESGNHVLINTLAYGVALGPWVLSSSAVRRGDIIAFERGRGDETKTFLKRVIAVPGETVELRDGVVSVGGTPIAEPYTPLVDRSNLKAVVVPAGSVFVLGDNRAESDDSRAFGPVAESSIIGKALFVIWPIGHVKRIR